MSLHTEARDAKILADQTAAIITRGCGCQESHYELLADARGDASIKAQARREFEQSECRPCEVKRIRAERAARREN